MVCRRTESAARWHWNAVVVGGNRVFVGVLSEDIDPSNQQMGTQEGALMIFSDVPSCGN
jgi:hypothetical protein